MNIQIYPREVLAKLLCLVFVLLVLNVIGIISKFYCDYSRIVCGLIVLFDFDTENNIPTFYSALALFFASTLLSIIAITHKRNGSAYLYWLGLAIIFLFLSIDEISLIHEQLPVKESLNTLGLPNFLLYFPWVVPWVVPYSVALIAFVIAYLKFLIRLPKNIMILFVVSGAIFVSGAIGFELLGSRQVELYVYNNLIQSFLYTCEEFLEMLGIVIFIYTLLTYMVSQFKPLTITVNKPKQLQS